MLLRQVFRVGVVKNVKAFRVGLHQTILDSVVNHLDEMTGARWAAMKIALFDGATGFFSSGRAPDVTASRRERSENRIEMTNGFFRAANHHAVTTLQAPDAAARPNIHVVDAFVTQRTSPPHVVFEI